MKIRLIGNGYDKMTGAFGDVEFKDGVSVGHVSDIQARFYASITSIENVDTGEDPGDNARFQAAMEMRAETVNLPTLAELEAAAGKPLLGDSSKEPKVMDEPKEEPSVEYTREQLEAVADKGGIAKLREIADKFGVKSTSIPKLIDGVMKAQEKKAPEAATLPEGQPDVVTAEKAE